MSLFEDISHGKKERKLITVDEAILKVGDRKVFVWAAIDVGN